MLLIQYCTGDKIEMRWAGHVEREGGDSMGRGEAYTGVWWGNLRERDHLRDPGIDGRIILRWIFRTLDVVAWTGSMWLRIGTGGGQNEPSGSIKCGEFLD